MLVRLRGLRLFLILILVSWRSLDRSTLCPVYALLEMAESERKNVARHPIRGYTSSACHSNTSVVPPFLKAAVGSESGGSCK